MPSHFTLRRWQASQARLTDDDIVGDSDVVETALNSLDSMRDPDVPPRWSQSRSRRPQSTEDGREWRRVRGLWGKAVEWSRCLLVGGVWIWSTGVLEYLFGPSEVWRRRDAHFIECGGEE